VVRVKDESQWQQQLADFAADSDPMADALPTFLTTWCDAAESVLDAWEEQQKGDGPLAPIRALRDTLRITEQTEGGRIQVGYLGMALVLICSHWEPTGDPNEFFESMTAIEQNLFADVAALKMLSMKLEAEAGANTDG
jgi:hypothetical protein